VRTVSLPYFTVSLRLLYIKRAQSSHHFLKGIFMFYRPSSSARARTGQRRGIQALVLAAALGVFGQALAQGMPGHGGRHGEPAAMMEHRIDGMLKMIGGTPEQKSKLVGLAQAAQSEMRPIQEQQAAARQRGMQLLSAATIDRAAIEKLRSEQVQLMDALSRRKSQLMVESAEVLTAAQRSQLAEKMKSRAQAHGGHGAKEGRGRRGGEHGAGGDAWWR
jgi:periplasmic protein CpxP/Spy